MTLKSIMRKKEEEEKKNSRKICLCIYLFILIFFFYKLKGQYNPTQFQNQDFVGIVAEKAMTKPTNNNKSFIELN